MVIRDRDDRDKWVHEFINLVAVVRMAAGDAMNAKQYMRYSTLGLKLSC